LDRIPTVQGYHLHTDRYYISIALAEELLTMKCYLTDIIKINKKKFTNYNKGIKVFKEKNCGI